MKIVWYKRNGIVFIPVSVIGVVLYILTVAFCITVFIAVDRNSHSVSDTFYGIFPYFVSAFTVLYWIAANTSSK